MIEINNQKLKNYGEPFIVAEAGINHNGELVKAFEMIEVAKQSGVDAVKFQTFKAEEFCGDKKQTFTYKSQGKKITESMFEMFKRYEFSRDEWFQIKQKCDDENILFLSTPQNRSDLDLLLELGLPVIKVGSDDFTNLPLLEDYATTKLPMIVSCGMSDLAEVYQALDIIGTFEGYPTILLLCTSQYPTPPEDVNILKLKTLSNAFPDLVLGFSDHTQGSLASSLASAIILSLIVLASFIIASLSNLASFANLSLSAVRFCISLRAFSAAANAFSIPDSLSSKEFKIGFQANFTINPIKANNKIVETTNNPGEKSFNKVSIL